MTGASPPAEDVPGGCGGGAAGREAAIAPPGRRRTAPPTARRLVVLSRCGVEMMGLARAEEEEEEEEEVSTAWGLKRAESFFARRLVVVLAAPSLSIDGVVPERLSFCVRAFHVFPELPEADEPIVGSGEAGWAVYERPVAAE